MVETNWAFDDQSQAYAAGWVEAQLTQTRIYQSYLVFAEPGTASNFTMQFAIQNILWTRSQLAARGIPTFALDHLFDSFADLVPEHQIVPSAGLMPNASSSAPLSDDQKYWLSVAANWAQMRGLYEGYVAAAPAATNQTLSWMCIYIIGYSIEMGDGTIASHFLCFFSRYSLLVSYECIIRGIFAHIVLQWRWLLPLI